MKIALVAQSLLLVALVVIVFSIRPAPLDVGFERMNAIIATERGKGRTVLADDMEQALTKIREEARGQMAPLVYMIPATFGIAILGLLVAGVRLRGARQPG